MVTRFDKDIQEFSNRLESGELRVEYIPNSGADSKERDERDLSAYKSHLNSATCKSFTDEVFGNGSGN